MHPRPSLVPKRNLETKNIYFFALFHLHILQSSRTSSHFNSPLVPKVEKIKDYNDRIPKAPIFFTKLI